MKKIVILSPYFGKFPETIELTFSTMEHNSTIDWVIFTDNTEYVNRYQNIKFIKMSFEDVKELINAKFGTFISTPYKICDYRPAYGVIFSKYVKGYDFWGYCDLDMIFGNLRKFFTEEKLEKYDKIYDAGHLSLYRNIESVSYAFMGSEEYKVPYKDIFNHKYNCIFDEVYNEDNRGINQVLEEQGFSVYVNRSEIADIDLKYKNFHIHDMEKVSDYYFIFDNGELILKRLSNPGFSYDVAYAHYQKRKKIPSCVTNMNQFISTPKAFLDISDSIDDMFFGSGDFCYLSYAEYRVNRFIGNVKARLWQKTHSDVSKYNFKLPSRKRNEG